jgi:hypothetical protein
MTKPPNAIFTLLVKSLLTNCKNFSIGANKRPNQYRER